LLEHGVIRPQRCVQALRTGPATCADARPMPPGSDRPTAPRMLINPTGS